MIVEILQNKNLYPTNNPQDKVRSSSQATVGQSRKEKVIFPLCKPIQGRGRGGLVTAEQHRLGKLPLIRHYGVLVIDRCGLRQTLTIVLRVFCSALHNRTDKCSCTVPDLIDSAIVFSRLMLLNNTFRLMIYTAGLP